MALTLNPTGSVSSTDAVRAELWISFVGLLRSHLAAHQTIGKLQQARFASLSPTEVEIVDLSRRLHISLPANGEGEWSLTRLSEMISAGVWQLHADATAEIEEIPYLDMEHAVEAFANKLWSQPASEATFDASRVGK